MKKSEEMTEKGEQKEFHIEMLTKQTYKIGDSRILMKELKE